MRLHNSQAGLDFDTCYAARLAVETDDLVIYFVDLPGLRRIKQASGRLKDIADLARLEAANVQPEPDGLTG